MSGPSLSVVVAASNGPAALAACLASLVGQPGVDEVIVSGHVDGAEVEASSSVTVLAQPPGTTVPMLRTWGIRAARGEVVALTEDHVTAAPGWATALRRAHAAGHDVVGGPVEQPDGGRARDWAVYFYEYGRWMPPLAEGPVPALAGPNASYTRAALDRVEAAWADGFYEVFVHQALQSRGVELWAEPAAVVHHPATYRTAAVVRQCYHHARSYAAMREAEQPGWHRLAMGAGALVLPVLLPARIAARTVRRGRRVGELARAWPYLVAFLSAWAAGEMVGSVAGPGESAGAWS